ncbi:putative Fumarylacetoacetase [Cardiosporidium cionae]|uniref:Fumarylacetoacetase n=1 Tax=Cardiosporidium cionae TaxID=476202 RepID=A0ABQ7JDP9_9APIC|nr:putative Fumarylacetoacetase [Cardiosporidium cionae]|eukprot:KAF8822142.1 putative Fumarylacetoacetase [Cardiosporidium cionae]
MASSNSFLHKVASGGRKAFQKAQLPRFLFPSAFETDFTIHNLPYGIFSTESATPRIGVAIGDQILDCSVLASHHLVPSSLGDATLNRFMAEGKMVWNETRASVQTLLSDDQAGSLKNMPSVLNAVLVPQAKAKMHLPASIGDYTDFYASKEHATNLGAMFRGRENALLPNWKHIPVGYHGRSSSICPSGIGIHRPWGQQQLKPDTDPIFQPSQRVDYELEMAFFVGPGNTLGKPIPMEEVENHVFGLVLMNDWSARDIQKWEYQPLGPFLAKNFGTILSPWVVPLAALEPFRCSNPKQDPPPLPYLRHPKDVLPSFDIQLEVSLRTEKSPTESLLSRMNFNKMYWTLFQQLVHHTSSGCNVQPGDLLASGTISGEDKESMGCLQEKSWGGSQPVELNTGETRTFLCDNDTVVIRGFCENESIRVGFGTLESTILPAVPKFFSE